MFKSVFGVACIAGSLGLGGVAVNETADAFGCPAAVSDAWNAAGIDGDAPAILKLTAQDLGLGVHGNDGRDGLRALAAGIQKITGHSVDCSAVSRPFAAARQGAGAIAGAAARDLPTWTNTQTSPAAQQADEAPAPAPERHVRISYRPAKIWR